MAIAVSKKEQGLSKANDVSATVIIIGAGPVGYRCAMELSALCANMEVILIGDEPCEPYNRIKLSSLLAGEIGASEIFTPIPLEGESSRVKYKKSFITKIDPAAKTILDTENTVLTYDYLILATGSRPRVPEIHGFDRDGVFTFRNLQDVETLGARRTKSKNCVVLGGGLLGLEVARGMCQGQTQVTILQYADQLMERQLDKNAARFFQTTIEKKGINVFVSTSIRKVKGSPSISAVETDAGEILPCDTLIICAGVAPNVELARDAGIEVERGIVVSSTLQTSCEDVYAIGECCEYESNLFGLVAPGLEQASVICQNLSRASTSIEAGAQYSLSTSFSQLKIGGEYVASLGDVEVAVNVANAEVIHYKRKREGIFRTLILQNNQLNAVCCVGRWDELQSLRCDFEPGIPLTAWQLLQFRLFGTVSLGTSSNHIDLLGDSGIVCHCMHVSKARVCKALDGNVESIADISKQTGAGSVCGSCHPQLLELIGSRSNNGFKLPDIPGKSLILKIASLVSLLAVIMWALPGLPSVASVQSLQYDLLWKSSLAKQVTGFTLLGVCTLSLLISLRKRMNWTFLGNYASLRVVHTIFGLTATVVLVAHTGAHLGTNLNRILMLNFLGVIVVGALAGCVLALANKIESGPVLKKMSYWAHIVITWPLPALIIAHIFSVYYF